MAKEAPLLVVVNGREEPIAEELVRILAAEGVKYVVMTGRHGALESIRDYDHSGVYLSSYEINLVFI
jgi:hypothetical protein